jgi:hypothetical protein
MISTSVTGDVSSSSIVPERFSSEYVRIVIIGMMNRMMTDAFCNTYRMTCWLTFCDPPNCATCMLLRTNIVRYR